MNFLLLILLSHGVTWRTLNQAVVLQVFYDDGTPIAYATVVVESADGKKLMEFEADSLGRIFFLPPGKGKWILKISDGLGHGVIVPVQTDQPLPPPRGTTPFEKALIGASLLWGIAGTIFYLLGRRHAHT